jgi:Xaa-Pro dipeptidase
MLFNSERANALLREAGVDAIVAAAQLSVDYVTDHRSSFESTFRRYHMVPGAGPELLFRSFAVATASGERTLVAHAATVSTALPDWSEGLVIYGAGGFDPAAAEAAEGSFRDLARSLARRSVEVTPLKALATAIRNVVPNGGRVAVETAGLQPGELSELRALLPGIELGDGSVLLRLIRMVKTDDEIARSRRAAEIAESALGAMVAEAAPGCTFAALAQIFRREIGAAGADLEHVAISPFGLGIATVSNYPLRERDVLLLDVGCLHRSCVSDTGITLALEPLAGEPAERYALVRDCLEAGSQVLAPGTPVSAVYSAMRAIVDGTDAERSLPQGHGLGLEPRELPFIGPPTDLRLADDVVDLAVDQSLEPGMVINLEVPLEKPGHYAVHVERTFLITNGGVEPITPQDRSRALVPGTRARSTSSERRR